MELYFLRHGIATNKAPEGSGDAARPLTEEGHEKMQAGAHGILKLGVKPDAILSSPFVRAHQTAEIVAEVCGTPVTIANELASGCDMARLGQALKAYHGARQLMVVGHEPDFSELIAALTGGNQVEMKKGGLARVDLSHIARGTGQLIWLLPPRVLRALATSKKLSE